MLLLAALPAPPAAAAPWEQACGQGSEEIPGREPARPVVLVHGWTSSAVAMKSAAKALQQGLGAGFRVLRFDYHRASRAWPALTDSEDGDTARCLALYLARASAAHRGGGGDGEVVAVGHSMGGIALRYAAQAIPSVPGGGAPERVLAGLVTLGTPHRGSPWGLTDTAQVVEATSVLASSVKDLRLPDAVPPEGSSARECLAPHDNEGRGRDERPDTCADVPYLPPGVPLTSIGTQITVTRTLFDLPLVGKQTAEIPLFGDGIVPAYSANGYFGSGAPGEGTGKNRGVEVAVRQVSDRCGYTTDYMLARALARKVRLPGLWKVVAGLVILELNVLGDAAATQSLLEGRAGVQLAELTSYAMLTPCSHLALPTHEPVVAEAVSAIRRFDAAARAAPQQPKAEAPAPGKDKYWALNEACRGGAPGAETEAACKAREAITEQVARESMNAFLDAWRARDRKRLEGLTAPQSLGHVPDAALAQELASSQPECDYDFKGGTYVCEVEVTNGDWGISVTFEHTNDLEWRATRVLPIDVG